LEHRFRYTAQKKILTKDNTYGSWLAPINKYFVQDQPNELKNDEIKRKFMNKEKPL